MIKIGVHSYTNLMASNLKSEAKFSVLLYSVAHVWPKIKLCYNTTDMQILGLDINKLITNGHENEKEHIH